VTQHIRKLITSGRCGTKQHLENTGFAYAMRRKVRAMKTKLILPKAISAVLFGASIPNCRPGAAKCCDNLATYAIFKVCCNLALHSLLQSNARCGARIADMGVEALESQLQTAATTLRQGPDFRLTRLISEVRERQGRPLVVAEASRILMFGVQ
jgi:hypothetical protein